MNASDKKLKRLIPVLETVLSLVIIALVVTLTIILINFYCSHLQLKSDVQNNVSGISTLINTIQSNKDQLLVQPKERVNISGLLPLTNQTFYISPNQPYVITSVYNKNEMYATTGTYNSSLMNGNFTFIGGITANSEPYFSQNNIGFTLIKPASSIPVSNGTFMMQLPQPSNFTPPWANGFVYLTQSTTAGGGLFYMGTTLINNPNDLNSQWQFTKLQDISSSEAVYLIQSNFNNLFMRICDTQNCVGCGGALTCGNSTNASYISVDFSITQATTDTRAQWILSAISS